MDTGRFLYSQLKSEFPKRGNPEIDLGKATQSWPQKDENDPSDHPFAVPWFRLGSLSVLTVKLPTLELGQWV